MNRFETALRFLVTSLAVWGLSRVLFGGSGGWWLGKAAQEDSSGGRFWAARAADFVCWMGVWLSSQTAIWIACGFAGVFLSWLSMAGASRLFLSASECAGTRDVAVAQGEDQGQLGRGDEMQVNHG